MTLEQIEAEGARRIRRARSNLAAVRLAERDLEQSVVDGTAEVTAADLALAREEVRLATLRVEAAERMAAEDVARYREKAQAARARRQGKAAAAQRLVELDSQLRAVRSGEARRRYEALVSEGGGAWGAGRKPFPTTEAEFFAKHPDHPEAAAFSASPVTGDVP